MKLREINNTPALLTAVLLCCTIILASCSTTSALPEGEQLYVGISKINYTNYERGSHFAATDCGCGTLFRTLKGNLVSGLGALSVRIRC